MAKFKPRHEYRPGAAATIQAPQTDQPTAEQQTALEDDLLQWAIRTFFETLFKKATDTITDAQVVEAFKVVVEQVVRLNADERTELIRDMDFFVGRIKANIEPVLCLWYRAVDQK